MCIICVVFDLDRITVKEARAALTEAKASGIVSPEHEAELEIKLMDAEFSEAIQNRVS